MRLGAYVDAARGLPRGWDTEGLMGVDEFMGRPDLVGDLGKYQARGALVAARPRYMREHGGEAAIAEAGRVLDAATHQLLLRPPFTAGWHPLSAVVAIDRVIVHTLMSGDVSKMKDFGAEIAAYDVPSLFQVLLRMASGRFVLQRAPLLYGMYLRPGHIAFAEQGENAGRISLSGGAIPRYLCRYGICGWVERTLLLTGQSHAEAVHDKCRHDGADVCAWQVSWG